MLHYVGDNIQDNFLADWVLERKNFSRLLSFIEERDYKTICFKDLIPNNGAADSSRNIILTFDDCAKHLLDFAVPELMKRKMKGVFFMPTAYTGGYNAWDEAKSETRLELMNADDLKDLAQNGMEVGSHSHHHIELKTTSVEVLKRELVLSKEIIESVTGSEVYSFSYPYGSVPENYRSVLSEAGYRFGVSIYQPFQTRLALRRFGVYNKDTEKSLATKFSFRYQLIRQLYDKIKKN